MKAYADCTTRFRHSAKDKNELSVAGQGLKPYAVACTGGRFTSASPLIDSWSSHPLNDSQHGQWWKHPGNDNRSGREEEDGAKRMLNWHHRDLCHLHLIPGNETREAATIDAASD